MPVRSQTEISVCTRPFCNFLEVSNIKVRFDYINNTKRGKTILGDPLLSSMGPGLLLEFINQKKNDSVSYSNVKAPLQAFIIRLLVQILSSYGYCGALVPSKQRDSLLNKADIMFSVTTIILRKAGNGIPTFLGKCLFRS